MTKKDYIKLAEIIRRNSVITSKYYAGVKDIAAVSFMADLCEMLRADNPHFNEAKFRKAISS